MPVCPRHREGRREFVTAVWLKSFSSHSVWSLSPCGRRRLLTAVMLRLLLWKEHNGSSVRMLQRDQERSDLPGRKMRSSVRVRWLAGRGRGAGQEWAGLTAQVRVLKRLSVPLGSN